MVKFVAMAKLDRTVNMETWGTTTIGDLPWWFKTYPNGVKILWGMYQDRYTPYAAVQIYDPNGNDLGRYFHVIENEETFLGAALAWSFIQVLDLALKG